MKKAGFIISGVSLSFLLYFFVRNMSVYVSILGENLKGTLIWAFNNEVYNLCFVALGVAAVLKSFYTLKKSAVICRYIAAAFAFAHLVHRRIKWIFHNRLVDLPLESSLFVDKMRKFLYWSDIVFVST